MARPRFSDDTKRTLGTFRADRSAKPRQPPPKAGKKLNKAELCKLWTEYFSVGHDGFSDLAMADILHPLPIPIVPKPRDKYELQEIMAAHEVVEHAIVKKAWRKLGQMWLRDIWRNGPALPWAEEQWGRPWER
jgi:hypothetical protein